MKISRCGVLSLLPLNGDSLDLAQRINEWDLAVSSAVAGLVLVIGVSGSGRRVVGPALAEALGCIDWDSARVMHRINELSTGISFGPAIFEGKPNQLPPRLHVGELREPDLETLQAVMEFIEKGGQVIAEVHASGPGGAMAALSSIYAADHTREAWSGLVDLLSHRSDVLLIGLSRLERGGPVYVDRRMLSDLNALPFKRSRRASGGS
jgi:hypothetical protein